jgi:hypothetical protein
MGSNMTSMPHRKLTWENIVETRQEDAGLSPVEIENAALALAHLRSVFGEDVTALSELLLRFLTNRAQWTYRWVVWLSDCLNRLMPAVGCPEIVKRLRHSKQFGEALSVIEVAERMHAAGFTVGFGTVTKVQGREKYPDLRLEDQTTGTVFYCEVSVSFSAERHIEASRILDRVFRNSLIQDGSSFSYAGMMGLPTADEDVDKLIELIRSEIAKIRSGASFREVTIPGLLTLALAPGKEADRVTAWANARGWHLNSFGVDPGPIYEGARLRRKIRDKVQQLPEGLPNVLVIPAQGLFFAVEDPLDLVATVVEIIAPYRDVAVLVVSGTATVVLSLSTITADNYLFATSERDGQKHQYLVVRNASCRAEIPAATLNKIRTAFSL